MIPPGIHSQYWGCSRSSFILFPQGSSPPCPSPCSSPSPQVACLALAPTASCGGGCLFHHLTHLRLRLQLQLRLPQRPRCTQMFASLPRLVQLLFLRFQSLCSSAYTHRGFRCSRHAGMLKDIIKCPFGYAPRLIRVKLVIGPYVKTSLLAASLAHYQ